MSGLTGADATEQDRVDFLYQCLTKEGLTVVMNMGLTDAEMANAATVVTKVEAYINGRVNTTVERRKLRDRRQQAGEKVDDYVISLRELAKTCAFCNNDCMEAAIRDQLVEGLESAEIVDELLKQRDLTLAKAIEVAQGLEAARNFRRGGRGSMPKVAKVGSTPQSKGKGRRGQPNAVRNEPSRTDLCRNCGGSKHSGGQRCPASDRDCSKCGKHGHYGRVCLSNPDAKKANNAGGTSGSTTKVAAIQAHPSRGRQSGEMFRPVRIGAIRTIESDRIEPAPRIKVIVESSDRANVIEMLPDTGADICAAGTEFLEQMDEHENNLLETTIQSLAVDGSRMDPMGMMRVTLRIGEREIKEEVYVFPNVGTPVLSWKAAKALGILPNTYPYPPTSIRAVEAATTTKNDRNDGGDGGPSDTDSHARLRVSFGSEATTRTTNDGSGTSAKAAGPPAAKKAAGPPAAKKTAGSPAAKRPAGPPAARKTTEPPAATQGDEAERIRAKLIKEFPTVFDGSIRVMPGETFRIVLRDDAKPCCVTSPRTVPIRYREPLKRELDKLEAKGIRGSSRSKRPARRGAFQSW